jgi:glycerol-3-phosphate acyltransferase PlsY
VQWEFGHSLIELSLVLLFVVLGHMFPIWLRFRGGKGVATAVGALAPLEPRAVLGAVIVFAIVLVLARYVSLASIAAAAVFPFFATNTSRYPAFWPFRHQIPLLCAYGVISALIILKHHANIRRLLNGTENKFGGKKKLEAVVKED